MEEKLERTEKRRGLPEWFWEYASISQIHGFSYINHSKESLCQLLFWICFVFAVVALCVYYTVGLVQTFIAQSTALQIVTTSNMSNFVFPEAVGCVEISFHDYVRQLLSDEAEASFNQTLLDFTQSGDLALLQNQDVVGVSTVLLGLNASIELAMTPPLSETFAAAAYALLTLAMDYDRGQPTSTSKLVAANLSSVLRLVEIFQAYIDQNNVSYGFLAKVIGTYMCRKLKMQMLLPTTYSMCATLDAVVYFGAPGYVPKEHVVCATFSSGNYTPFNNVNDILFFTSAQGAIYDDGKPTSISRPLYMYFDPWGGRSTRDPFHFDSLLVDPFYWFAFGGLQANGRYVWLNRTASRCGAVDPFMCAEKALLAQITKNRSCSSLIGLPAISTPKACSERYSIAEANQTDPQMAIDNWQTILSGCPQRECDSTQFTPVTFAAFDPALGGVNQTSIMVYPQPVLFFTNTEYYLMDGQGFLNAFGGLIGWWIGGSLVAIVHVIVFGLKLVLDRFVGCTKFASHFSLVDRFKLLELEIVKVCRELGSTTCFHGFPFLVVETNVFAVILWLILLPVCIALTIQETIVLVDQYNTVPVQTAIAVQSNATVAFDDAAICIGFSRAGMFSPPYTPNSTVSFNQSVQTFMASNIEYLREIGPILNSSLDPVVMVMSYMMVTSFIDYDTSVPAAIATAYNQTTLEEIDIFTQVLIDNNIDMFQFTKLTAAFMCDVLFQLRVFYHRYDIATSSLVDIPYNPCQDLRLFTWAADNPLLPCAIAPCVDTIDTVCVKLPSNLTTFTTPYDYLSVQALNNPGESINGLYFDLRHGAGILDSTSYDSQVDTSAGVTLSSAVSVSSESRQYNSSVAPCSDRILFDSALSCFSANVSAERNCWPLNHLSLAEKPLGMPPCLTHYSLEEAVANSSAAPSGVFKACEQQCTLPCFSRIYTFTSSSAGTPRSGIVCQVDVHPNSFVYFVYTTEPSMDVWALLWGIGGLMGLWIGGSAITLLHVPVFFLSALFRRFVSSGGEADRESTARKKKLAKSYVAENLQADFSPDGRVNNDYLPLSLCANSVVYL